MARNSKPTTEQAAPAGGEAPREHPQEAPSSTDDGRQAPDGVSSGEPELVDEVVSDRSPEVLEQARVDEPVMSDDPTDLGGLGGRSLDDVVGSLPGEDGSSVTGSEAWDPLGGLSDPLDQPPDPTDLGSLPGGDPAGAIDDLSDPGGLGDLGDGGGGGIPEIDDQTGWAMDEGDGGWDYWEPLDASTPASSSSDYMDAFVENSDMAAAAAALGDDAAADAYMASAAHALAAATETMWEEAEDAGTEADILEIEPTVIGSDDDDDERESQGSTDGDEGGPEESQTTMPIPEEQEFGPGGLDGSLGGDVDPAPETEPAGGRGGLDGSLGGDVDPAPEVEDPGGSGSLDTSIFGAIDPVHGESSLLAADGGAGLAELDDAAAELGDDVEIDLEGELADLEITEDV